MQLYTLNTTVLKSTVNMPPSWICFCLHIQPWIDSTLPCIHFDIERSEGLKVKLSLMRRNLPNALRSPEVVLFSFTPPIVSLSVVLELPVAVTVTKPDATALLETRPIDVESSLLSSLCVVCSESVLSSIGLSVLARLSWVVVPCFILEVPVLALPVNVTVSDNPVAEFPPSIVVLLTSLLCPVS